MAESRQHRVLVAGAGVAGLETVLALRDLAGDRVARILLDPAEIFTFRPLTVAEPFGVAAAARYPLADLAAAAGAELVADGLAAVEPARHVVRTIGGDELEYEVLVLALGARIMPAFAGATTFDPDDAGALTALVGGVDDGTASRVAVLVPGGPHWALPAYELALLLARRPGAVVTLVTTERTPLELFGDVASDAVADELSEAGVRIELAARPRVQGTSVELGDGRELQADAVVALPAVTARTVPGVPVAPGGFIAVDEHGRVAGVPDVYAAGDLTTVTVKQGGIAAQQADAVAHHIAHRFGASVEPEPFAGVLRGRLLTGHGDRWLRRDPGAGTSEYAGHCLWWPPGKVAGRWLAPFLADQDLAVLGLGPAPGHGVTIERPIPAAVPMPYDFELLRGEDERGAE